MLAARIIIYYRDEQGRSFLGGVIHHPKYCSCSTSLVNAALWGVAECPHSRTIFFKGLIYRWL
jgi:predicted nucleic acid-binding Zn finger protein